SLAAIYAVMASGLVVTQTTTGIFNFAHGAVGMLAAFAYWQLRFDWNWPAPIALAVVLLVFAPGIGLLLDWLVFKRIRDASEAIKLVVTISLLTGMISLARWIWDPNVARPMSKFFASSKALHIGPTTITWHQAITIFVALFVAGALRLVLFRTRLGLAMRASVDDPSLAVLNGARPELAAKLAWCLGSTLAALGGILIAPNIALDAASLSLLIVSAYAAAVVGRLRNLPMTFVGALIVGLTEAMLSGYLPRNQYLTGLRLASPALILFVVLLFMPHHRLKTRVRSRESFPVPQWRGSLIFAATAIALGVVLATTLSDSDQITYAHIFSYALIALSLVPLAGYSGQISLCQLSLAAIGGLAYTHLGNGSPWGLVWAMLIAAAVGSLIALPALRLSGLYLALGTAAFAIVLDKWIFTMPKFSVFGWFDVSLFDQGSVEVRPLHLFGATFDGSGAQIVVGAVLFSLASLVVVALRRSFFGRRLIATRDSEAACATLGGNVIVTKVSVFAISSAIAGLGGAVYSVQSGTISANFFDFVSGLPIFVLAVVGGVAAVGGAFFAGINLVGALPALVALAPSLSNVVALMPGMAGVGMGRAPNGAVFYMRHGWSSLIDNKRMSALFAALLAGWYAVRIGGLVGNWPFVAGLVVIVMVVRIPSRVIEARRGVDRTPKVPPEWRGVGQPWVTADGPAIDRELSIAAGERGSGA
ncbi:MAG: transporter permease, partial [Ilumatobacteraceae bacterium]|nr:transporter permease [Ilumatobacteraceae bacterium]